MSVMLFFIAVLFIHSYQQFVFFVLDALHSLDKIAQVKALILTPNKFVVLRVTVLVLTALLAFSYKMIVPFVSQCNDQLFYFIGMICYRCRQVWCDLKKVERGIFITVLAILLLQKIYLLYAIPLGIDELFSFVYLSSKGLLVVATYYPGPNNHILYNLLVAVLCHCKLDALWAIRLPAIISGCVLFVMVFVYVQYRSHFWLAMLVSVAISFSEPVMSFTIQGRGYGLQLLFLCMALIALVEWMKYGTVFYVKSALIVTTIVGFYTVPTYLYPFVSIVILILVSASINQLKGLFWIILKSMLGVVLLYCPIIFFNGLDALLNNNWVKAMPLDIWIQRFWRYFQQLISFCLGIDNDYIIVLFMVFLLGVLAERSLRLWLVFFIVPLLLIAVQGVLPFVRIFTYLSMMVYAAAAFLTYKVFKKLQVTSSLSVIILIGIILSVNGWGWINEVKVLNTAQTTEKFELYKSQIKPATFYKILVLDEKIALQLMYLKITDPHYKLLDIHLADRNVNYDMEIPKKR
jgi:hypothetical protein